MSYFHLYAMFCWILREKCLKNTILGNDYWSIIIDSESIVNLIVQYEY